MKWWSLELVPLAPLNRGGQLSRKRIRDGVKL